MQGETKMRRTQQFYQTDIVRVGDLGYSQTHFNQDTIACVMGTYEELCNNSAPGRYAYAEEDEVKYELLFLTGNTSAWYHEKDLTLLERGREDYRIRPGTEEVGKHDLGKYAEEVLRAKT